MCIYAVQTRKDDDHWSQRKYTYDKMDIEDRK